MLAHHACNGCNMRPGDLFGSGTVSGPAESSAACLLELSENGSKPLALPGGESRTFLEIGDELTLAGRCERTGFRAIGLGACSGIITD